MYSISNCSFYRVYGVDSGRLRLMVEYCIFNVTKFFSSALFFAKIFSGELIPGSAVLIFHLHVIDFHNPKDQVDIKVIYKPADCNLTSAENDLILYQYNCSLLDGTRLYSS